MKFYFFIAVVMSSVASADYIRKTFVEPVVLGGKGFSRVLEKKAAYGGEEVFGARIHIGGLLEAPTKEELDVLDQVLPEAFNAAHASIGFKMDNSTSKTTLSRRRDEVDHDFMIIAEFTVQWNGGFCKLCAPDFGDRECYTDPVCEEVLVEKRAEAHLNFEMHLCQKLLASGMTSYLKVTDCSFLIVENPGSFSTRLTEETVYESRNHWQTGAEISILGLREDPPEDAVKFVEITLLEAHNVAVAKFRYSISEFEVVSMIPYSNDDAVDAFLFFGHTTPHSDSSYDPPAESEIATIYQEIETTFCNALKESGNAIFANIHDCTFRFVYNPAKEVPRAQNNEEQQHAPADVQSA